MSYLIGFSSRTLCKYFLHFVISLLVKSFIIGFYVESSDNKIIILMLHSILSISVLAPLSAKVSIIFLWICREEWEVFKSEKNISLWKIDWRHILNSIVNAQVRFVSVFFSNKITMLSYEVVLWCSMKVSLITWYWVDKTTNNLDQKKYFKVMGLIPFT